MFTTLSALGLAVALSFEPLAQESTTVDEAFPTSTALAQGVSPDALARLGQLVQTLVDEEEIVGAELLVIKGGRSILHQAYGWRDREADVPMETDSVFCVRSMTKPVIGAAILMLVEDDLLELGDRAAQYLPAFDVEGSRDITIEHLLSHTSGLPMSLLLGKDLRELGDIQAAAALGGGYDLAFEPGSAISYSDQGTDTLTAVIEVVTGMSAADFVRTRVLEPLGMRDSACVMIEDHPLRARGCNKYVGSRGLWTRFWGPDEPPVFPFFLGSQGLYSTTTDYARFMEFWLRRGRPGKERLLKPRYVRKALAPTPHAFRGSTGFPGLIGSYGFLMQLWTSGAEEEVDADEREVVVFGHTGSDGTHAWVFPEQDAMVFYFTQSRGNITGLRVEEALGELFLGVPYDPNLAAPPLEPYLGYYWEGEGDLYRAIVRDGGGLALEVMGKAVVPLTYAGEDRWKPQADPSSVLAFERSQAGEVTGYRIGDHREARFEPAADLPGVEELAKRVAQAHRLDLLESLATVRMHGELEIQAFGVTGELTTLLAWPDRYRVDSVVAEQYERVAFDGERLWYASSQAPVEHITGTRAELLSGDNALARFGDWHRWYSGAQVIQRLEQGADELILVRMGDTSSPATTLYVDWKTGRVVREDGMTHVDTMGRMGQRVSFGDFRDVSGMLLPFRSEYEFPNPMLGTIVTTVEEVELGVELAAGTFQLEE